MKTTQEYFNMTIDELLTDGNDYGYTREECKLFDEGLKVHFSDSEEYNEEREDVIKWYKKSQGLDLILESEMINHRIAMVFN